MITYKDFISRYVITEEKFNNILSKLPKICIRKFDWDYFDDSFWPMDEDEVLSGIISGISGLETIDVKEKSIELDSSEYTISEVIDIINEGWTVTNYSDFVNDKDTAKLVAKIQAKASKSQLEEFLKTL